MKKLLLLAVVLFSSCVLFSACSSGSDDEGDSSASYGFTLDSTFGDEEMYTFAVTAVGPIWAEATWTGTAENLALILNGPGQVSYYARVDGKSPLSLSYPVTVADIAKGTGWRVSIVNFGGGEAAGTVKITYPAGP